MREVNIYIQSGINSTRPADGIVGYILELPTDKGPVTYTAFEKMRATANGSELRGMAAALKKLKEKCHLTVYTDNDYVAAAFSEGWIDTWIQNGWNNSKGLPVAHAEEWQELLSLLSDHEYKFVLKELHGYWHWLCGQIKNRQGAGKTARKG